MRFLHPPRDVEGLTVSTTSVTDSRDRIVSSDSLPWDAIPTAKGALMPDRVTASYHGVVTPTGTTRWVINAHVTGRLLGKSGRRTANYDTAWYLVTPDQHSDERASWPPWLIAWLEKYHPDRVTSLTRSGPDPEGSYL